MLRVIIQHLGERAVIRCVGRIVAGREANTLREAVLSQRKRGAVMLDLTGVDAVDGGGIGLLVFLQSWARAVGINLQLLNPAPHVRELLQLTNLDSVFKILSSADPVSSLAEIGKNDGVLFGQALALIRATGIGPLASRS